MEAVTEALTIDLGGATDVGRVRELNEDSHEFVHASAGEVLVLCDGMGGHASGEVASRVACDQLVTNLLTLRLPDARELIYRAVERAHAEVRAIAQRDEAKRGMGTTCVVALIRNGALWFGNVGDSRLYLLRGGVVKQLSVDQTKVQALVARGIITSEAAATHPDAGVLSQAIGQSKEIEPYVVSEERGFPLQAGDVLLLCSDGVYDCLKPEDFTRFLAPQAASDAARLIVKEATARDGKDNASAIVARVRAATSVLAVQRQPGDTQPEQIAFAEDPAPSAGGPILKLKRSRWRTPLLAFLSGIAVMALASLIARRLWCGGTTSASEPQNGAQSKGQASGAAVAASDRAATNQPRAGFDTPPAAGAPSASASASASAAATGGPKPASGATLAKPRPTTTSTSLSGSTSAAPPSTSTLPTATIAAPSPTGSAAGSSR